MPRATYAADRPLMPRTLFEDEHEQFRQSFRTFIQREVAPHFASWEAAGVVSRDLFLAAGRAGFLGMQVPGGYGGGGTDDFRFNAVISEELMYGGYGGVLLCFST